MLQPYTSPLFFLFLLLVLLHIPYFLSALPLLPEPDPASIQSFHPAPPATISAFPEQSDLTTCPLSLSDELFHGISNACGEKAHRTGQLSKSRCCPVLAAWLYSAYASTALGRAGNVSASAPYELPVLPEDSESCVDNLEKALMGRGIVLKKPNDTCDVVYCYCNIRLHPLSCPKAFTVSSEGKLVGGGSVRMLEKDCLSTNKDQTSISRCSKCLNRLYQLKEEKNITTSTESERRSKIRSRDCELMGLTWLLSKNQTAYIHTVSTVLRALMMSTDGSDPKSCSLSSDGMPLAVGADELDNNSSIRTHPLIVASSSIFVCATIIFTLFLYN